MVKEPEERGVARGKRTKKREKEKNVGAKTSEYDRTAACEAEEGRNEGGKGEGAEESTRREEKEGRAK